MISHGNKWFGPGWNTYDFVEIMKLDYECVTWLLCRAEMDHFAVESHAKAAAATAAGHFKSEIINLEGRSKDGTPVTHDSDEGIRAGTTAEKLGGEQLTLFCSFCSSG